MWEDVIWSDRELWRSSQPQPGRRCRCSTMRPRNLFDVRRGGMRQVRPPSMSSGSIGHAIAWFRAYKIRAFRIAALGGILLRERAAAERVCASGWAGCTIDGQSLRGGPWRTHVLSGATWPCRAFTSTCSRSVTGIHFDAPQRFLKWPPADRTDVLQPLSFTLRSLYPALARA